MVNKYQQYSKVDKEALFQRIHRKGATACSKKKSFETYEEAMRFIERRELNQEPYQCPHCTAIHLTTKSKKA